jgi:protein-tyrosine phosphatase
MADFPLVDIHSHLVPAVDDGARDPGEAVSALRALHAQGVRRLATTPHLRGELTLDPPAFGKRMDALDRGWSQLLSAASATGLDVVVERGHEVMLDVPRPDLSDARVRLGGGSTVLVEFPRLQLPPGSAEALYELRVRGVSPLVAHPERYATLRPADLSVVDAWRQAGARTVVNAGSLVGAFGPQAERLAFAMLREGMVDAIASDYHARPGRPLLLTAALERLLEAGGEEQAELLLSINPGRLLDGEEPLEVPPLIRDRPSLGRRLAGILGMGKRT